MADYSSVLGVTYGILTSSINKGKYCEKKLNKPNPEIENAYRIYRRLFNNIKRSANTKYHTEILEESKHIIKQTWTILR